MFLGTSNKIHHLNPELHVVTSSPCSAEQIAQNVSNKKRSTGIFPKFNYMSINTNIYIFQYAVYRQTDIHSFTYIHTFTYTLMYTSTILYTHMLLRIIFLPVCQN